MSVVTRRVAIFCGLSSISAAPIQSSPKSVVVEAAGRLAVDITNDRLKQIARENFPGMTIFSDVIPVYGRNGLPRLAKAVCMYADTHDNPALSTGTIEAFYGVSVSRDGSFFLTRMPND